MNIKPDFAHRLAWKGDAPAPESELTDTIGLMTDRGIAILELLATQFETEDALQIKAMYVYTALDSAIKELEDIKCLARAFNLANR